MIDPYATPVVCKTHTHTIHTCTREYTMRVCACTHTYELTHTFTPYTGLYAHIHTCSHTHMCTHTATAPHKLENMVVEQVAPWV